MYKAKFRTAYDQREIPVDAVVVGADNLEVGALVEVEFFENNYAVIKAVTANSIAAAKEQGTHIIAQSDQTMEYGHVPVEDRDYRYNSEVKATIGALANFDGFYDSADALATAQGNGKSGHSALVKISDGVYAKYTSDAEAYTKGNETVSLKKVALFEAVANDTIVYDKENN